MIYTVTLNPSLDYYVTVEDFIPGQVNRTIHEVIYAGGKGINVSMVLKNLELPSVAFGFVGGFTGEEVQRSLKQKGIHTDFIAVKDGNTRINIKIRGKEESEINGLGPHVSDEEIKQLFQKLNELQDGDILVLAGSIPSTLPDTLYMDIMEKLSEKRIKVAVDATQDLLSNVLQFKPFLIKPNNHELGELFGTTITTKEEVIRYGKQIRERGARNVLVSMAGEGAVLLAEDGNVYTSKAPKGVLKNSVGAGDSMVAGFLAGYLKTGDYESAFKMGICTGSASAFSEVLATKSEVDELMEKHQIDNGECI